MAFMFSNTRIRLMTELHLTYLIEQENNCFKAFFSIEYPLNVRMQQYAAG